MSVFVEGYGWETDLLLDVIERIGRVDSETDQDNVRVGVR